MQMVKATAKRERGMDRSQDSRCAQLYRFKMAPGYPGIHGLSESSFGAVQKRRTSAFVMGGLRSFTHARTHARADF